MIVLHFNTIQSQEILSMPAIFFSSGAPYARSPQVSAWVQRPPRPEQQHRRLGGVPVFVRRFAQCAGF
jgi:hypothetical protein